MNEIYLRVSLFSIMGKRKHNVKGRQVKDVIVDNSETKKVTSEHIYKIFHAMCFTITISKFFADKTGFGSGRN